MLYLVLSPVLVLSFLLVRLLSLLACFTCRLFCVCACSMLCCCPPFSHSALSFSSPQIRSRRVRGVSHVTPPDERAPLTSVVIPIGSVFRRRAAPSALECYLIRLPGFDEDQGTLRVGLVDISGYTEGTYASIVEGGHFSLPCSFESLPSWASFALSNLLNYPPPFGRVSPRVSSPLLTSSPLPLLAPLMVAPIEDTTTHMATFCQCWYCVISVWDVISCFALAGTPTQGVRGRSKGETKVTVVQPYTHATSRMLCLMYNIDPPKRHPASRFLGKHTAAHTAVGACCHITRLLQHLACCNITMDEGVSDVKKCV